MSGLFSAAARAGPPGGANPPPTGAAAGEVSLSTQTIWGDRPAWEDDGDEAVRRSITQLPGDIGTRLEVVLCSTRRAELLSHSS